MINRRNILLGTSLILIGIFLPGCRTSRAPEGFTFVQLCDPQLGMGGYEHDVASFSQAVMQINLLNPDFVFICGDLVQDRNAQSFSDFKRIRDGFSIPCHCAAGNHDVGNVPTRESLEHYRSVIGKDYYSFEHKGYTFVVVNTQLWKVNVPDESERQAVWLKDVLEDAAGKNSPVFIVGHYPLFLKAPDEAEEYMNLPVGRRTELLELFERSGVVAVLGGHAHRLMINNYNGIQMVNGETTSKNFDQRPMGFRFWNISDAGQASHSFIPLESETGALHENN